MIYVIVDHCGQITHISLTSIFYPKVACVKKEAVGAAKASAFRMTALSPELLTPIIIKEMQSLPLSIYSMMSGLSENHYLHWVKKNTDHVVASCDRGQ